jgi:uncharacterized membrane protein
VLAGVAVALSAGSKTRRTGDAWTATRMVVRRGFEIFLLAFLFRFQSLVLSWAPARTMLKVDILNVMGPSIMLAALLWYLGGVRTGQEARHQTLRRAALFAAVTAAIVWMTPVVRGFGWLAPLPDPVEAYFRPTADLANFTLFPWMAFVTAGACFGVFVDAARTPDVDRRVNIAGLATGLALAGVAWWASFRPPVVPSSRFWTTSASFFFLRLGLMAVVTGLAWLWERRPSAGRRWSPLQLLGRHSLFIYWIHVEMVYGLMSLPLHQAFSLAGAWVGLWLFCGLMVASAAAKSWWDNKSFKSSNLQSKLDGRMQAL